MSVEGISHTILPLTYFIHLPVKMEPTVSSETSAIRTQKPGNYPKKKTLHAYKNCTYIIVFLMMNTRCSKHVKDKKN